MAAEPCRYALADAAHVCVRNDGSPVRAHGVCFYEAASQLREQNVAAGVADVADAAVYQMLAGAIVVAGSRKERAS